MSHAVALRRRAAGLCIYCGRRPPVGRTGCRDCLAYIRDSRKPHGRGSVSVPMAVYERVQAAADARGLSRTAVLESLLAPLLGTA